MNPSPSARSQKLRNVKPPARLVEKERDERKGRVEEWGSDVLTAWRWKKKK
ncbi:MAG: hypothetical protein AVDCRST_MAG96-544 [uncultured Segetibacter sp.]|uniref:Uncharacterized protein n=1 Tax=uncultured Segetibacter sp. TaxID=481133 RepID=A0A6J4RMQ4_9BACT|nr:MAG: hypothetical protein AVDCRST_MAG96-544 [uncultured Segetibacter sp.]